MTVHISTREARAIAPTAGGTRCACGRCHCYFPMDEPGVCAPCLTNVSHGYPKAWAEAEQVVTDSPRPRAI